ncbi:hypothetical protein CTEN210_08601 [Chaetoceros tenuissimus]|uniref:NAD(P)-binding protein n=1 Tax=Chaetoceros tenuissimus TaxID=426638 RepID=A0AAD3CWA5_9STRA|nr:hypothetical protein CTEN210_08601 [Chaetoceros tenuissimus]
MRLSSFHRLIALSSLNPLVFGSAFSLSNTISKSSLQRGLAMSTSTSEFAKSTIEFPKPVAVQPGTSPVEEQLVSNPIDSTCKVLIVGASRGIGLEFVKQILEKGSTVIATYRSEQPSALQTLSEKYPETLHLLELDLGDEVSIQNAAKEYQNMNIGSLTHLIHNGGIYLPETTFDGSARGPRAAAPAVTKSAMMRTFEINTIAPLIVAQNFAPLLGKRDETLPVIAYMTSKVGSIDDNGSGGAYAYRSSKSALNNIAKSLSSDLCEEARVVLLHPGYVQTDMTSGKGFITAEESVSGLLKAIEATDNDKGFRFVDYKACLIPW